MLTAQDFQSQVEAFLQRSGMKASTFGKEALGDPSFVLELRKGRVPSLTTAARVIQFMEAQSASAA